MDRIADIIAHEKAAEKDDTTVSAHRWAASRLMWEEVRAGRTKAELGTEIGKSRQHVIFMVKCWEIIGRHYSGDDYSAYPNFNSVYRSPEVRGESARKRGVGKHKPGPESDDRPENAAKWISTADASLDQLAMNPAAWDFLGDEDMATLRAISGKARTVLAAVESRFASAKDAA
jgi:hypothetical protein